MTAADFDDGGSAFPRLQTDAWAEKFSGMTLRDYFAAKAMQAWFPAWERDKDFDLADRAYKLADSMLKARAKS